MGKGERGQPDRTAHVVGEGEERTAVHAGPAVQRDAVHDRAHGVLTDAEVERAPVRAARPHLGLPVRGQERGRPIDRGAVTLRQVGRTAPQLRQDRIQGSENLAGGLPGGHALRIGVPGRQGVRPALRQRAGGQPFQQRAAIGGAGPPRIEALLPSGVRLLAPDGDPAGVLKHLRGDLKGSVGVEAEDVLGRPDLVLAQRRPVGGPGVLLVRRGPADDRPQHDQRRAAGLGLGGGQRAVDRRQVLAIVDVLHVPAVGLIPHADVLSERDAGVVLDRDPVGVVDQDQVPQLLGTGQRRCLAADTLLEVAV